MTEEAKAALRSAPRHRISVNGADVRLHDAAEAWALALSLAEDVPHARIHVTYSNPTVHDEQALLEYHLRRVRGQKPPGAATAEDL